MPKRNPQKLYEWRITRIRSTPAALIGHVEAADAEQAIREAISNTRSPARRSKIDWQPSG
jgi:hypothetical protein